MFLFVAYVKSHLRLALYPLTTIINPPMQMRVRGGGSPGFPEGPQGVLDARSLFLARFFVAASCYVASEPLHSHN